MVNKELKAYLVGMAGFFGGIAIPIATAGIGAYADKALGGTGMGGSAIGIIAGTLPAIYYSCSLFDLANAIQGLSPEP